MPPTTSPTAPLHQSGRIAGEFSSDEADRSEFHGVNRRSVEMSLRAIGENRDRPFQRRRLRTSACRPSTYPSLR